MNAVELVFEITGFDRILYDSAAQWERCSFEMQDSSSARMRIWEEVCWPGQVEEKRRVIYDRLRLFALALEFEYGFELRWKEVRATIPSFSDSIGSAVINERICFGDTLADEIRPAPPPPPPKTMPSLSPTRERFVRTFVEATRFQDYVEEQLRRHYLIIEELWSQLEYQFSKQDGNNKRWIKLVRHFVSHSVCDDSEVVSLIENALPCAVVKDGSKKKVRFLRNVTHRNFVAPYEAISRDLARRLIERVS